MTGPKVAQRIQVVSILLHEAKAVLGLFCLHLNLIGSDIVETVTSETETCLKFRDETETLS